MIRICLLLAAASAFGSLGSAQGVRPGGEIVTETVEEFAVTPDDRQVARKRISKTDRTGQLTETESVSAPLDVADGAETLPASASVRTVIRNRNAELDVLEIVARAKTITETATPDGTTRIIRIVPEGGASAILITITKD
jgi:hypothetical protein